jgi:hypothetical protein
MDDTRATIHSLPPELLGDILSHLFTTDEIHLDSLKSASLVHSSWQHPAQAFIWAAGAELNSSDDVEQYIRTSARRRGGPREVAVHGYKDAEQLKRTAMAHDRDGESSIGRDGFGGPSTSRFVSFSLASPSAILILSFTDLRTLIVQAPLRVTPPSLSLPFSLHTLVLDDLSFGSSHVASLLTALQSSCIPSLRSIALPGFSSNSHRTVAAALVPFMPHLSHFGLSIALKDDASPYLPALSAATSLNSFECTSLPTLILQNLPPSLAVLATPEDAEKLDGPALSEALRALPRLRKLYFHTSQEAFEKGVEGGEGLVKEMRARGVKWWFAGEED